MKKRHTIISLALALVLVLGTFAGLTVTAGAEEGSSRVNDKGLVENVEGGSVLHCWCWSFNTIKANLQKIAEAGYSAVQTSPINAVMNAENSGMSLYSNGQGKWYYAYQPTEYTIGNFMLGTEDEFISMCETAHGYGVKVIVDIVANHTTSQKAFVKGELKTLKNNNVLYHTDSGNSADIRRNMTQHYATCPDVNTQNKDYQNIILNFLKKCVADGADGFRYDMAKHIELPDDDASYASDFWPTILENGSIFEYGEILQSPYDRFKDYANIMHVTASNFGDSVRSYFYNGCSNSSASAFKTYNSNLVTADRLVCWVESHDTYANDNNKVVNSGASFWMTNDQIRRGWALIAARKDNTCLFFSRPAGSQATTNVELLNNPRWGNNQIGAAGDDNYFHPEVVAVNKFKTAMLGESENIENISKNNKLLVVTRGTRGAVLINNSNQDIALDEALGHKTALKDGTYTDSANGGKFYAYNGRLFGTLKAESVSVIYDDASIYSAEVPAEYQIIIEDPTEPKPTTITASGDKSKIYVGGTAKVTAAVENPVGETAFASNNTSVATVDAEGNVKALKSGTVTITASNNNVSADVEITIVKKTQKMTVKTKTISAKAKKTLTFTKAKAFVIKNAKGTITFTRKSGNSKITVNKKTGKVTVKKGLKKGKSYSVKIAVKAAGNNAYKSITKTVKLTVKVK